MPSSNFRKLLNAVTQTFSSKTNFGLGALTALASVTSAAASLTGPLVLARGLGKVFSEDESTTQNDIWIVTAYGLLWTTSRVLSSVRVMLLSKPTSRSFP